MLILKGRIGTEQDTGTFKIPILITINTIVATFIQSSLKK